MAIAILAKRRKENMRALLQGVTIALGCCVSGGAFAAAAPADAPAGTTGLCKDGSYTSGETKKGACKGHKGVKDWYAASDAKSAKHESKAEKKAEMTEKAEKAEKSTAAPAGAAAPSAAPAAAATSAMAPAKTTSAHEPAATAAPGGGPGMVWVNTSSKVYHCPSDKWYGKTKAGEYMSEADAKAKGNHAEHGKACS